MQVAVAEGKLLHHPPKESLDRPHSLLEHHLTDSLELTGAHIASATACMRLSACGPGGAGAGAGADMDCPVAWLMTVILWLPCRAAVHVEDGAPG